MAIKETPQTPKRSHSLMVRVIAFAVPLTTIQCIVFAVTGYPVEEWPFAAGVFTITLFLSGHLLTWLLLFVGIRINNYIQLVLRERGLDATIADTDISAPNISQRLLTLVVLLLMAMAVWGLSFNVLAIVLHHMAAAPLEAKLILIARIILAVGAGWLALVLSVNFALAYALRHLQRQWPRMYNATGLVFRTISLSDKASRLWRLAG